MDTTTRPGLSLVNGHEPLNVDYRSARVDDTAELLSLFHRKFYPEHEFGGQHFEVDLTKSERYIRDKLVTGVGFVASVDYAIVGSVAVYPYSPWWTSDPALVDAWFFVDPAYRASRIAVTLMELARKYAKREEVPLLLGIYNSKDMERKEAFFERKGFVNVGGWYIAAGG